MYFVAFVTYFPDLRNHIMLSVQWGNILLSTQQHKFLHDSWEEEEDTVIFEIYVLF